MTVRLVSATLVLDQPRPLGTFQFHDDRDGEPMLRQVNVNETDTPPGYVLTDINGDELTVTNDAVRWEANRIVRVLTMPAEEVAKRAAATHAVLRSGLLERGEEDDVAMLDVGFKELERESDPDLFYRDRSTFPVWDPLPDLHTAQRLVRSRTEAVPWVSVQRRIENGPAGIVASTFEVLGWADRVYVCGDVASDEGWQWRWSSWPIGSWNRPLKSTWVGPPHFRFELYDAQVVTVSDALIQLEPGLRAVPYELYQAPGFAWRGRRHDLDENEYLRT